MTFTPDLTVLGNNANWRSLRTIYAGGRTPSYRGTFHEGCDVTNPGNDTDDIPYNTVDCGKFNIGDATLFLLNGLALIGRAKVFYDRLEGFPDALVPGATLGRAWRAEFDHDAADGALATEPYKHEKAYFWNLLGDWTLRVKYRSARLRARRSAGARRGRPR